jgi:hypothetical protein
MVKVAAKFYGIHFRHPQNFQPDKTEQLQGRYLIDLP